MRTARLGFLILTSGLMAFCGSASAQDYRGMCLDNIDEGCTERFIEFNRMSLDFCESTCTLVNPVKVRDLKATLYDFDCASDNPDNESSRVMILEQVDWNGRAETMLIDGREIRKIVRCP